MAKASPYRPQSRTPPRSPDHRKDQYKNRGDRSPQTIRQRKEQQLLNERRAKRDSVIDDLRGLNIVHRSALPYDDFDVEYSDVPVKRKIWKHVPDWCTPFALLGPNASKEPLDGDLKEDDWNGDVWMDIVTELQSDDPRQHLHGTRWIRKLFERDPELLIHPVVNMGGIEYMAEFFPSASRDLQLEVVWVLSCLLAQDDRGLSDSRIEYYVDQVVRTGLARSMVQILATNMPNLSLPFEGYAIQLIRQHALDALASLSAHFPRPRNLLIEWGVAPLVLRLLEYEQTGQRALTAPERGSVVKLFRGLSRGTPEQPPLPFNTLTPILASLPDFIADEDTFTISNTCWTVLHLLHGVGCSESRRIDAVLRTGILPRLVELAAHPAWRINTPAFRAVEFLLMQTDGELTRSVCELGLARSLTQLLSLSDVPVPEYEGQFLPMSFECPDDGVETDVRSSAARLLQSLSA